MLGFPVWAAYSITASRKARWLGAKAQSGLLIMPQCLAAISLKFTIPAVPIRLGYRRVLGINTLLRDWVIGLFAVVGKATSLPRWRR